MIRIDSISKWYNSKMVLNKVSFCLLPGEIIGLLGPNGSGKTTTLSIIVGLIDSDQGTVELNNTQFATKNNLNQEVGFVSDDIELYDFLTGREYIKFVGQIRGIQLKYINSFIEQMSKDLLMEGSIESLISEYSKGMRKKITLMASLVHQPKLLVLDEPLVGLDPGSIRVIKKYLKSYARLGNSIIISTHLMDVAEKLCDKFIILSKGEIVASGNVKELKISIENNKQAEIKDLESIFHFYTEKI